MSKKNRKKKQQKDFSMDNVQSLASSPSGGWSNFFNNFGIETDPNFNTSWLPPLEFRERELIDLQQNTLVRRALNLYSEDGTRKGFSLTSKSDNEKASDIKKDMDKRFQWLALGAKMIAIWKLHAGGVIYADIDDGRDPEEPLNENAVRKVYSFQTIDRWNAHPLTAYPIFREEKPNQPMHYLINIQGFRNNESFKCHESRLIRFPSYEADSVISNTERTKRNTWEIPCAQITYDSVKNYGIGMQSMSSLLQGFVEDVYKVANLDSFKNPQEMAAYLRQVRLYRNSLKATAIGEKDVLEKLATPTAGMGEITKDQRRDIGMVWEIPVPIFFSEESGDLGGSTLDVSRLIWADKTKSNQINKYTPMFRRMLELTALETKWDLEEIDFDWHSIIEPTEMELIEMKYKQADTDSKYYAMGMPEQMIFESRFSGEKTNLDAMNYDADEYEKELKEQEEKDLEESQRQLDALQNAGTDQEKETPAA